MKIGFFEEYPNSITLKKLNLIKFPTKLYLADYSIYGYKALVQKIKKDYPLAKEFVYWPIVNVKDGYWFSPWTRRKALLRSLHELMNSKTKILWDAEFPKNKKLFFTQIFKKRKNKKLIKGFFNKEGNRIYTAEYFTKNKLLNRVLRKNHLFFNSNIYNNKIIKMMYSSIHSYKKETKEDLLKKEIKKHGNRLLVGLGVTAKGMTKREKLITPQALEEDLELCKKLNIKEIVIYRLGGLNKDYIKVINKFVKD